ncbi:MAG TPA: (5-formylfuran-3-yl)methyl phosphate synthase [Gemmatimonadales bacterium]|nr:(5-formylfuran-3-yl)methyl phosphate synthase [Gemmatimonadales bacterium]
MKLLVSVADAAEARAAVEGGADIIDAKDPTTGALGRVSLSVMQGIRETVASSMPLSAALGEVRFPDEVSGQFDGIDVPLSFVKLGLHGFDAASCARSIAAGVAHASRLPGEPGLVVVGFADIQKADGLARAAGLAVREGADGFLVDTARKAAGSLFDYCTTGDLRDIHSSLPTGFSFAVAGSLKAEDIAAVIEVDADVMGVRGAACESGRASRVSSAAVARLVETLRQANLSRRAHPPAAGVVSAPAR